MAIGDDGGMGRGSSDGGLAAAHQTEDVVPVSVAPSTADGLNTIRLRLVPIACWRVDDIRFEFGSSFVLPSVTGELTLLANLIAAHGDPGPPVRPPPLSLFGHADPVGNDDYNKLLSGRRAAAIYGLLTRRDEVWEDLYSGGGTFAKSISGDDWGTKAIQNMLNLLVGPLVVDGEMGPDTRQSIKDFQMQNGLAADGVNGPATRKQLFLAYMDNLCLDADGQPFQIDKADGFLAHNADPSGKGDFQGCGELNPVLIFSEEANNGFERGDNKAARNAANAPNRRVMGLLFRPGSAVDPARWPCPLAKDGIDACKKRFFSDGEERRSKRLPDEDREFKNTADTFACRFYDRISNNSPCERHIPFSRFPVYFCTVTDDVPVLDAPDANANTVGTLEQGDLVRVLAEKYTDDAFFIRIERVAAGPDVTYYDAPLPPARYDWICVARQGDRFAFWSNVEGAALSQGTETKDLDDRFVSISPDV